MKIREKITNGLREISFYSDVAVLRPTMISISMTNRCNSKCGTCSLWKDKSAEGELSCEDWQTIISKIRDWYGPFQFSISGGEPFLRKDLCNIIRHAVNLGCYPTLITNGLLMSKKQILRLADAGLKEVVFSLNGTTEETHDFTRGVPGGFRKIMQAIDDVQRYGNGMPVGIATILMGYNLSELPDMVRWVKERGLSRISFQALFYETGASSYQEGWYNESKLWQPRLGSYDECIDQLIEMKTAGYPIKNCESQLRQFKSYFGNPDVTLPIACKIGIHGFFVGPDGSVRLCYLFDPVGNLLEESPSRLWNSARTRAIRREIRKCPLNCRLKNCNYAA